LFYFYCKNIYIDYLMSLLNNAGIVDLNDYWIPSTLAVIPASCDSDTWTLDLDYCNSMVQVWC
jgi:hypothetical protein